MTIQFYKSRDYKKCGLSSYFLVDMDSLEQPTRGDRNPTYTSYAPIGQHSGVCPDYLRYNSIKITKEEYIKASEGFYTPDDYLEGADSTPELEICPLCGDYLQVDHECGVN
jgi:hypothetical protein